MKDLFKNYTLGSLVCCIMGAALLINPHLITEVLNTVVGVVLIVWGALGTIKCIAGKSSNSQGDINIFSLLGSIALGVGGLYVFKNPDLLERVLMAVLGIYLICSGLPKLIASVHIKEEGSDGWTKPFITSCLTVMLGLVVLVVPALLPGIIMRLIGLLLIAGGVGNFIGGQSSSKLVRELHENHEYKYGKPAEPAAVEIVDIEDFSEHQ